MAERFDVVVVPDFLGRRSYLFEVCTLFFLASWLENAGQARSLPLHMACIGEPPRSVGWLASRCEAVITVHPTYRTGGFWNKLRGLEIQGREEQVLLLDVDIAVCSDISGLGEFGRCIAVAPTGLPRVPQPYWEQIYRALGMEPPTERIASLVGELNAPPPKRRAKTLPYSAYTAMIPCYNGGVIFAPWDCGLGRLWEEHLQTIAGLFSPGDAIGRVVARSNQPSLATAIEVLKRQGIPVRRLPSTYNADLTYVYRGAVSPGEVKILHAIGLFHALRPNGDGFRAAIASFLGKEIYSIARDACRRDVESSQRARAVRQLLPSVIKAIHLGRLLDRLHRKYVRLALSHSEGVRDVSVR